jgi:hypothetical protein
MDIKDYLHLYIGSSLQVEYGYKGTKKIGILTGYDEVYGWQIFRSEVVLAPYVTVRDELIKPILRPLSDITKEDVDLGDFIPEYEILQQGFTGGYCIELDSIQNDGYCLTIYPDGSMWCICKDNGENYPYKGGEFFKQLLSKHFDLFGLIEAGLAIDSTTLKESVI